MTSLLFIPIHFIYHSNRLYTEVSKKLDLLKEQ